MVSDGRKLDAETWRVLREDVTVRGASLRIVNAGRLDWCLVCGHLRRGWPTLGQLRSPATDGEYSSLSMCREHAREAGLLW